MKTVGIMSPGEMGQAIGAVLRERGMPTIAALDGRSQRTRRLAAEARIADVGSVERLVSEADLVLSVLVPSEAVAGAEDVAQALRSTGGQLLYADCNAIAPQTTRQVGSIVESAGGRFIDASIIGSPPSRSHSPRVYASGEAAAELQELASYGLDIRVLGGDVGQASALKMCYASLTKGLTALMTELLISARRLGADESLRAELLASQAALYEWAARSIPSMPPKAHRWIGEMEEIAATFEGAGLTPRMLLGAADMYRFVAETPLGHETPEERDQARDLESVIESLAQVPTASSRVG
ncbi:MAG TPA: DUF1932 domain-containing protein [Chloroflexota bacterium]|nr:DUF1932 domain-containing protein [Chloroflexota bacterium]